MLNLLSYSAAGRSPTNTTTVSSSSSSSSSSRCKYTTTAAAAAAADLSTQQQQQHEEHLLEADFIHDVLGGHDVFVCGANELHGKGHRAIGGIKVEHARVCNSKERGHILVVG